MSWTDPCARCDQHRADCDCKEGYAASWQIVLEKKKKERNEILKNISIEKEDYEKLQQQLVEKTKEIDAAKERICRLMEIQQECQEWLNTVGGVL